MDEESIIVVAEPTPPAREPGSAAAWLGGLAVVLAGLVGAALLLDDDEPSADNRVPDDIADDGDIADESEADDAAAPGALAVAETVVPDPGRRVVLDAYGIGFTVPSAWDRVSDATLWEGGAGYLLIEEIALDAAAAAAEEAEFPLPGHGRPGIVDEVLIDGVVARRVRSHDPGTDPASVAAMFIDGADLPGELELTGSLVLRARDVDLDALIDTMFIASPGVAGEPRVCGPGWTGGPIGIQVAAGSLPLVDGRDADLLLSTEVERITATARIDGYATVPIVVGVHGPEHVSRISVAPGASAGSVAVFLPDGSWTPERPSGRLVDLEFDGCELAVVGSEPVG